MSYATKSSPMSAAGDECERVNRDHVDPGVLHDRLRELRDAGFVELADPAGYALTPLGRELLERFRPLVTWSERWADALRRQR